jgi:hypothetical protein
MLGLGSRPVRVMAPSQFGSENGVSLWLWTLVALSTANTGPGHRGWGNAIRWRCPKVPASWHRPEAAKACTHS